VNGVATPRVPTTYLAKRRGHDWGLALRVARLCRRLRPHLVHARNWGTMDAVIGARLARVPVVIHSEHGRDVTDLDGLRHARLRVRRLLTPFVDMHVTVSEHLQQWLLEHVRVRPEKVRVVPNGVDTTRFKPLVDRDRLRQQHGYAPTDLVFGAVGRLTPVKDYRALLEAFQQLSQRQSRSRLLIVGDGPDRPGLEAELQQRGLAARVQLAGFREDVAPWLGMMDVFVHPSLMEGMSNSVLEAMAVGLPVVATAVGGTPEIVEPGVTGLLVPPATPAALLDAMDAYGSNPDTRAAHAVAGRERAMTRFPLLKMIAGYSAVYRDALARRAAAGASITRATDD
jgi:sugar transferase (PEP-CTERM/EpsH1 system associated)